MEIILINLIQLRDNLWHAIRRKNAVMAIKGVLIMKGRGFSYESIFYVVKYSS